MISVYFCVNNVRILESFYCLIFELMIEFFSNKEEFAGDNSGKEIIRNDL